MTREEYGIAYERGFGRTVRFLVSRGLSCESAEETAQGAWVKGWEKVSQLRDSRYLMTWLNSIALNMHLTSLRHRPSLTAALDVSDVPNLAAIDAQDVLKICKETDRLLLQRHYIEGYTVREIATAQGSTETAVRIRLFRARRAAAKR